MGDRNQMTAGCYTSITHTLMYTVAAGSPWSGQEAPMVLCMACCKASENVSLLQPSEWCSSCVMLLFSTWLLNLLTAKLFVGRYWWGRRSQEVGGTGGDGDPKRWEVLVGTEIPRGGDRDPKWGGTGGDGDPKWGGTGGDGDPRRWEVLVGTETPGGGRYWWGRRPQEVGGTGGDGDPGGGAGDPIPDATLPSPE